MRPFLALESRRTRRKRLAENNWMKKLSGQLVEKQLAKKSQVENSSQEQKIFSDKYRANFVIVLRYEVLNCYDVRTMSPIPPQTAAGELRHKV